MPRYEISGATPHEDEVAAAIAALSCLLAEEGQAGAEQAAQPASWRGASRLISQGISPTRTAAAPRWGNIERLRRAGRGGGGIVGS